MRRSLTLLFCSALLVAGCGQISQSRYNPLNWFGRAQPVAADVAVNGALPSLVPVGRALQVVETRPLVPTITNVEVMRAATGGILRASAQTGAAGYYNAELVLVSIENGVATYDFRAMPPATPVSGQTGLIAAEPLSATELRGIRQFIVRGAGNAMTVRR